MDLIKTLDKIKENSQIEAQDIETLNYRLEMIQKDFLQTFQFFKGKEYILDEENRKQVDLLSQYFINHPSFLDPKNKTNSEVSDYNFEKGLIILGNVGCGKTETLKNFSKILTKFGNGFVFHSCLDVEESFATNGYEALGQFSKPYTKCFDDLGFDDVVKFYGNEERIMIRIIEKRHRLFIDNGVKTHFTTNLSGKEIMNRYGERTHSRIKEMCNIINYKSDARDRRR